MIKIVTIIGARPQIIKAAALSRAIKNKFSSKIEDIIVHTGQHYDTNMSAIFFEELGIPLPNYNLNVGSGKHGVQTAKMIEGIETILEKEKPNALVLYGDTNSTLAGAIAASKIHIPIVHIEAGLRSYNKNMPEEINRIMCDHAATLLFSPTQTGFSNLEKEGFNTKNNSPFTSNNPGVFHCGDIMFDNSIYFSNLSDSKSTILDKYQLQKNKYLLATIHRNDNTDVPIHLSNIFSALIDIAASDNNTIVIPLHPRTQKLLSQNLSPQLYEKITQSKSLLIIEPVSFLDMIALEKNASMIITDSGGVQKEAYFFEKPCIILRPETEWIELVTFGAALIAGNDSKTIKKAYEHFSSEKSIRFPQVFGNGDAATYICNQIIANF